MKVYLDEVCKPAITFDQEGYRTFLHERGITDADIDRLTVSLLRPHPCIRHVEQRWGAYFRQTRTIEMYLWIPTLETATLNHTLLHETRHFMQDCEGNGDHAHELSLPYHERPCEIDARSFADQHSPHYAFVAVSGTFKVAMHAKLKEELRTWWTRNDELRLFRGIRGLLL